jgi:hypothetical protein
VKKDGTSSNWGGLREDAGRKSTPVSEIEKKKLLKALKARGKEVGKAWQDILVDFLYGNDPKERSMAFKLVTEILITKESYAKDNQGKESGVVELPALKPKEDKQVATA